MKKLLIYLLIMALTCSVTACKTTTNEPVPPVNNTPTTNETGDIEQVIPPLADASYDTLEDASNKIGYTVNYPASLNSATTTYGIKNNSLEILFFNGKVMTGRIIKARIGNPPETDFYGYASTTIEIREDAVYTIHYTNEEECHLITWSNDDFLYLLYTSEIHTSESIVDIATQIK